MCGGIQNNQTQCHIQEEAKYKFILENNVVIFNLQYNLEGLILQCDIKIKKFFSIWAAFLNFFLKTFFVTQDIWDWGSNLASFISSEQTVHIEEIVFPCISCEKVLV